MRSRLPLLLSLAAVALGLLWLFALNHRFFFMDDRQAQYFPYGLVIRDMLLHGEFPFVTTRTFYGSALWLDWQYAIYNPVSLLMTFLILPQHLELSGLFYGLIGNLLLAGAAYRLGRAYGLAREWSALFGMLAALDPYIVYFDATSWHPSVMSLAWLFLAWAELKDLLEDDGNVARHTLVSALFMYLMVSAGWPHSDIAFAVIAGCLFLQEFSSGRRRRALRLIPAGLLGAALCLPVIVPALVAYPWTARGAIPPNPLLKPPLFDLLQFSNPLWQPSLTAGDAQPTTATPVMFVAWFALPVLFLIDWRKLRARPILPLAGLALIFFLFAAGASGGLLRYPVRWLPFMHGCGLLALVFTLRAGEIVVSRSRVVWAFAALAGPAALGLALYPHPSPAALAMAAACLLSLVFLTTHGVRNLPAYLGATSLAVALLIFFAFPANDTSRGEGKGDTTVQATAQSASDPVTYTATVATQRVMPSGGSDEREYMIAAMGAYYNANTLNGYSSLGQRGFEKIVLCSHHTFELCMFHPAYLEQREPETGANYLDLFKVGRIVTENGNTSDFMKQRLPPGWKIIPRQTTTLFERVQGIPLPGTLSWRSKGVTVSEPSGAGGNGEFLQVTAGAKPGLLVFARLFYPGFHATLNGAPLSVRALNDTLVAVEVPAHATGDLKLSFLPPELLPCLTASALALILWGFFAVRERRRKG